MIQVLEKIDAEDFSEINSEGKFDFTDVPIPFEKLKRNDQQKQSTY